MSEPADPITLELIQSSLQAAADEMFVAMRRTAMSSIIYEVLDMGTGITDGDGRLSDWGAGVAPASGRSYRLTFDTGRWFEAHGIAAFYPEVAITFRVDDDRHHHVPLLLAPYAYSTYRGN